MLTNNLNTFYMLGTIYIDLVAHCNNLTRLDIINSVTHMKKLKQNKRL